MRSNNCYIETRPNIPTNQISLDLARHLPRRLSTGRTIIITESPKNYLAVIRKRWAQVLREVRYQRACTLNPTRKKELDLELDRLCNAQFVASTPECTPNADVYLIEPSQLSAAELGNKRWTSVYSTTQLGDTHLETIQNLIEPFGVLILYFEWPGSN